VFILGSTLTGNQYNDTNSENFWLDGIATEYLATLYIVNADLLGEFGNSSSSECKI